MSDTELLKQLRDDLDVYMSDSIMGIAHMSVDWRKVFKVRILQINAALSKAKGQKPNGEG